VARNEAALAQRIERLLTVGLSLSGVTLIAGLLTGRSGLLRLGLVILVGTPVARLVLLSVALAARRDYLFAVLSFAVLSVVIGAALIAVLG
jgi:uncharacterized membrane protein